MMQQQKEKYRHDYRATDYTITNIHLDFDLNADITTVTAISTVVLQGKAGTPLVLNGKDLRLINLQIDGKEPTRYRLEEDILIIEELPNTFTLTVKTLIYPKNNTALDGLYLSKKTICTQCEAEGFRHITFYLDRPDVLARFTTRILADKKQYPYLLSNGNLVNFGDTGEGKHWVVWEDPFPKPSYLFALVAGNFDVLQDKFITCSGREVKLEIFVDCGNLERADWAMASLKRAMRWDETRFGFEYDLDIYMIVAVDFFNMGAMENKGLNIFNAKYVLARMDTATDIDYLNIERVIGHEYFHNWTGNRITCRDWFQLSLKEGLTVFRDQEFSSDIGSRVVNRINNVRIMRSEQFAEDASPMAHPIRPDKVIEINNFYTLTVYEKGAEVIRMLHTLLGEEKFQAGMRYYVSRHDGNAVTCEDFLVSMEEAVKIDLTLFRRWYSQSGTPLLTVRDDYNNTLNQYTLYVTQKTLPTLDQPEKKSLHIPLDIELYDVHGAVIPLQYNGVMLNKILNINESIQSFTFDRVPSRPIPSLLRNFSAPVRVDYPYRDKELITLMLFSTNDFSRWDATQSLLSIYVRLNVTLYQTGNSLNLPLHIVDAFRKILSNPGLDPALVAEIIMLPTENEMASWFDCVDPIAIHHVRNVLTIWIANELRDEFLTVYRSNPRGIYRIEHRDIGLRALRNCCLYYLAFGDEKLAVHLITEQYHQADNMTDTLAAIVAATAAQLPCQNQLLTQFDDRWYQDGLVMDKWFKVQATSPAPDVLYKVKTLLNHRSFNLKNPNRVRALIGAFSSNNPAAFHEVNGNGYAFLVEILTDLNIYNPQLSSIMVEPLIRVKRYNLERQKLMYSALEDLKNLENLSGDLFEKVSKALTKV
ncbi:aminopeptidase N [secondary endosymbiont of Heteropsylla cubana]|uniref:Aminopeptidase N n=1 Tax=secondary endosymbiont of Heteropsylla cubana TaxID=134287 RepID=J3TGZ8_9ENTR|nr:aminopeptidase N [secondary endosymbiont of Heteropsylla cubana]AFP85812.1 aminopeptidase N [secondary endosymbiont of Heteropsylla cubana]